jgi:Bacterial pre-peptidase C-terminal domain
MHPLPLTALAVCAALPAIVLPVHASLGENLKPDSITIAKSIPTAPVTQPQLAEGPSEPDPEAVLLDEMGVLEEGDEIIASDNSLFDTYAFEGQAGQVVQISVLSEEFDTYLIVLDENGTELGQIDDIDTGDTNSELTLTLPNDGQYVVVVNGLDSTSEGNYRVMAIVQ